MKPFTRIFSDITLAAILATALHAAPNAEKPNIVLIFADDLGYGDLGCYGATKLKTPRIDSLAAEGRKFTDAHSASAVCSPSRYGLLTGSYPLRHNFWGPTPTWTQGLTIDPKTLTLASLLKEAGYATACIGKWHLGIGDPKPDWNGELKPGPLELGFDYFFGNPGVNSYPPFVYVENHRVVGLDPDDPLVLGKKSVTKKFPEKVGTDLREKSIEWLKQRKADQPFFLYLATTHIHHPFTPAKQFIGTSECGLTGDPAKPLRETMVITPNSPKHLGLRKGKWVYIPAQGAGGFQGERPGGHLFSDAAALPFTTGNHSDYDENGKILPDAPPAQLYDLEADPGQQTNVFADHPELVKELEAELAPYRQAIPNTKPVGWINLQQ